MNRGCRKLCTCKLHRGPRWIPLLNFDVKCWGGSNSHLGLGVPVVVSRLPPDVQSKAESDT